MAIHIADTAKTYGGYGATKNAGTMMVQMIARGVSPDDMQVLSFHPGVVYTESVAKAGVPREAFNWDDGKIQAFDKPLVISSP
jgi:NAD(P)-dependent dehydrogenase (short-subunit alcohol dehydrogenase family)